LNVQLLKMVMDNSPSVYLAPALPPKFSVEEADAINDRVNNLRASGQFDPSDRVILQDMVECLGDSRGTVRLRFATVLGEIGQPATNILLQALAEHPNPVVRRAVAKTLTLIGDPAAVPGLVQAVLHDEDTVVKSSSVGALARTGQIAVPTLLSLLTDSTTPENLKGLAAWALAFIGLEAKDALLEQIHSDSVEVRSAIVAAIVKMAQEAPDDRMFEILVEALQDRDLTVRLEAISALGNLAYQPAQPQLFALLTAGDGETRRSAVLALMKMGDTAAIPQLETALTAEPEEGIQKVIQLAIGQLQRQMDDDDWD
jgi:bilin biosynthesis protein